MTLTKWRKRNNIPSNKHLAAKARQYARAKYWYLDSRQAIENHLGNKIGSDLAIQFIAATSPRNSVKRDLSLALREIDHYINHQPVSRRYGIASPTIYKNVLRVCGLRPLRGAKTLAFALALAGNENAIVLDTWTMKAFNRPWIQGPELRHIPVIIRKIAKTVNMTPAQVQACLWTYAKTELNNTGHRELDSFSKYFKEGR